MAFKVGVGKSDFASLRESGNYYVDKTELIYELVNDTDNEVKYRYRVPLRKCYNTPEMLQEYYIPCQKHLTRHFL